MSKKDKKRFIFMALEEWDDGILFVSMKNMKMPLKISEVIVGNVDGTERKFKPVKEERK